MTKPELLELLEDEDVRAAVIEIISGAVATGGRTRQFLVGNRGPEYFKPPSVSRKELEELIPTVEKQSMASMRRILKSRCRLRCCFCRLLRIFRRPAIA